MEFSLPQSTLPHRLSSTKIISSQLKPAVTLTKSEQLWKEAYRIVKERELALMQSYEKNLSPENTAFTSPSQIQDAVKASLDNREAHQIILTLVGKPIKIREYGEKLVRFTMWSKDLISSAVSTEPHAALAWAGLSLLLPIALRPSQESDAMLQGLDSISNIIQIYKIRETLYLHTSDHAEFEEAVTQLYSYIFEYQARMLCHLSRKSLTRAFQNIIKAGQWDDLLRTAREWDSRCLSYSNLIDLKLEREQRDRQLLQMDRSHHIQERIMDELETIRLQRAAERADDLHRDFFHAFSSRYSEDKDFNPPRVPGTCQWFLEDARFRDWRDTENSCILWISAGPGCGKSVLSKSLVDERLVSHRTLTSTICYFFFKDGQEGRQSGADALTAILHQLYSSNLQSSLVNHALKKFKIYGKSLSGMFGELWEILTETAKDPAAGEIICVIDALDECEQRARQQFLNKLIYFYSRHEVRSDTGIRLKFLITGRPYNSIQSGLNQLSNAVGYIHFDADDNYESISQDINKVIDHYTPRVLGSKFDHDGQKEITNYLKAAKHRTYLWLYLTLDVMKTRTATHGTKKKMRTLVSELPLSVSAAYEQILSKSLDAQLARVILHTVLVSRRPLTVSEMNVVLEITTGDVYSLYSDLDLQSEDAFKSSICEICGLFVTIYDSQVYLIHQTAREFLLSNPDFHEVGKVSSRSAAGWEHTINTIDAELLMAKACMLFLLLKEFFVLRTWATDTTTPWYEWDDKYCHELRPFVFLEYASQYWPMHYAAIQQSTDHALLNQALVLCDNDGTPFRTWYPIFCAKQRLPVSFDRHKLTIACELGFHVWLEQLLKESPRIDDRNSNLDPGLQAASEGGHEKVVQMLLDAKADVNAKGGQYSDTALHRASDSGHEKVVQMLLDAKADVNAEGRYGTALQRASGRGHEKVVQLLLDTKANVNAKGGEYGTALQRASWSGHGKVVQLLLDAEADMNTEGRHGTALQMASWSGHEKVVQLLLDAEADVNTEGRYSTALQIASENGHEKVVQILLDAKANVNAKEWNVTALQIASRNGHDKVVQLLLDAEADVNAEGRHGTVLQIASRNGHDKVVQLLLDAKADVNAEGGDYRGTALQAASMNGHEKVVQILLNAEADVNTEGRHGTVLQIASRNGHDKVVQLLLDAEADVNAEGRHGTVLQIASRNGHDKVVQLLLDAEADVNTEGRHGTALQIASWSGHEKVVQLLLDAEADVNAEGGDYRGTALQAASRGGHEKVVQLLLDAKADVNAARGDFSGTALQAASENGHEKVVQLLLDAEADVNAEGGDYGTALQRASESGHEKVVQLLLDAKADVKTKGGQYSDTALQRASENGHGKVVQLLLDAEADVNAEGRYGTALQRASDSGHEKVVQLLLDAKADVNAEGGDYGTALQRASKSGHEKVVQMLLDAGADFDESSLISTSE